MAPEPILETPRLRLRELHAGDAGFIHALLNDPDFLRNIGDRGVHSHEDALRYIATGPQASYASRGWGLWAVERRDDGVLVGMCGLVSRDTLPGPDLGYAFLPTWRGQGYAFEAAAATLDFAFTRAGLDRVLAIVTPSNAGSVRVLEKLGMREERRQAFGGEPLAVYAADRPAG